MRGAFHRLWSARNIWLGLLPGLGYMVFILVEGGFRSLGPFLLTVLTLALGLYVQHRAARPLRSYLAAGLVSAWLAVLLYLTAAGPVAMLFWAALSAGGLFWAWYWERTEPLPPAA